MLLSLVAVPLIWIFFLWVLPRLEELTLAPEERAQKIQGILENDSPEEIELQVAQFLSQAVRDQGRSRRRPVRVAERIGRPRIRIKYRPEESRQASKSGSVDSQGGQRT